MFPAGAASLADGVSKERIGFSMALWQSSILFGQTAISPIMGSVAKNYQFQGLFLFNTLLLLAVLGFVGAFLRKSAK